MHKYSGTDNKKSFKLSGSWKKRYFILKRVKETALLVYYNSKPKSSKDEPKGRSNVLVTIINIIMTCVAVTQREKGGDTLSFNAKVDLVNF